MITTRIIADSLNPAGSRLTSFMLTYPRFIHSEFMTHRVFSRNAASSRAIPFAKMLEAIESEPAMPEYFGKEQKGMQSGEEMSELDKRAAINNIDGIRRFAAHWILETKEATGLHKSIANRYLEPWAHITVLATATDAGLANFFALRASPMAQPEFQVLAFRMLADYIASKPSKLEWGQWHIPSFKNDFQGDLNEGERLKIATARCARLSYLTFNGDHSREKDIELHDRLAASGHWSPFEHCAQAVECKSGNATLHHLSNFDVGGRPSHWRQYRKHFDNENQTRVDLEKLMSEKPEWITI